MLGHWGMAHYKREENAFGSQWTGGLGKWKFQSPETKMSIWKVFLYLEIGFKVELHNATMLSFHFLSTLKFSGKKNESEFLIQIYSFAMLLSWTSDLQDISLTVTSLVSFRSST